MDCLSSPLQSSSLSVAVVRAPRNLPLQPCQSSRPQRSTSLTERTMETTHHQLSKSNTTNPLSNTSNTSSHNHPSPKRIRSNTIQTKDSKFSTTSHTPNPTKDMLPTTTKEDTNRPPLSLHLSANKAPRHRCPHHTSCSSQLVVLPATQSARL